MIASGILGRNRVFAGSARAALLGLALASGCATTQATRSEGEPGKIIAELRAENAGHVRRIEELENQVFLLTSELENRRRAEGPAPAGPPVALPEVKLSPGEATPLPPSDPADRPLTLVDEAEVEYAGAAAERGAGKRPVLKIYGPGAGDDATEVASDDAQEAATVAGRRARDRRRATLGRRPPHPVPAPARASAPMPTVKALPAADASLYEAGLAHLRARRHDEAATAFRAFVAANPEHDLADNAQYWLAECFYDRKDYSTALREFRRVAEAFPTGNKVPDALLKLGLAYLALGSTQPAREALGELVRRFPQHASAELAKARLGTLPPAGKDVAAALAPGASGKEVR